jgi:hypothetical protein
MILSTKPRDMQQAFLHSFPPTDPNFLQCAGGSRTRISENLTQLKVSDLDRFMYGAHLNSSANIQGKLKPEIPVGSRIHLVPYINYALSAESAETLSARDNYYLTPQFETTSTALFQHLRDYDKIFKELLLKDEEFISYVTSQINKKMGVINEVIKTAKSQGVEIDANSLAIESSPYRDAILFEAKAGGIGELLEYNDEAGNFEWSEEKILRLATKEFLANFFTKTKTLEEQRPHQALIDAISQEAGLFSLETLNHLTTLLKSSESEEVIIGVEALWTLAEKMVGNSKLQVVRTVNDLEGGEQGLANIKSHLEQYPNYQHKVDRIKSNFDVYVNNPAVTACLTLDPEQEQQRSLGILLSAGATTEEIIQYCNNTDIESLKSDFNQPITEHDGSTKTVIDKMKQRPDYNNLLEKLEEIELIDVASISLSDFLEKKPNQKRFLNYISKRSEINLKQDFQNTSESNNSLTTLLNNFDALKILKQKAIVFTPSLQIQILEAFKQNQPSDPEPEATKIVYFLKHFLTSEEAIISQGFDLRHSDFPTNHLSGMPHTQLLIAKLKEPDEEAWTTPIKNNCQGSFSKLLRDVASSGNVDEKADEIKLAVALGLNLNIIGSKAAHIAAKKGHLNVLELLSECGGEKSLDTKNELNKRPIHTAIQTGNAEIFNYLLEREVRTKPNRSPFYDYVTRPINTAVVSIEMASLLPPIYLLAAIPAALDLAFSQNPREKINFYGKFIKAQTVGKMNEVTTNSDPLLTAEAARYGRADFLKTLLNLGLKTPFVPEVHDPEIRKILDAGERAEEIAKLMISVVKKSPGVLMDKEALKEMEKQIRVALLEKYEFNANAMERAFGLKSKTLFERLTPHFFRKNIGHTIAANELVKSTANIALESLKNPREQEGLTNILPEEPMNISALDAATSVPNTSPMTIKPNPLTNNTVRSLSQTQTQKSQPQKV